MSTLDINDQNDVYIACEPFSSKWRDLGARLGVLETTLANVEADHRLEGVERCMSAMISVWLRRPQGKVTDGVIPTWRNLCVALSPIDRGLAEGIAVLHDCNYISPIVSEITKQSDISPAFLSYSCGCGRCAVKNWMTCQSSSLRPVTQPKLWIVEPAQFMQFVQFENHHTRQLRLCCETKYLIYLFNLLSSNTWNRFNHLLGSGVIQASNVARELGSKLRVNLPDLSDFEKIQNFTHLHNVNWFSFDLLYFMHNTFLREHCPEVTAEWDTYLALFREYCSARSLKDFVGVFFQVEDQNIFLVEIDEWYYNFTLADVDSFRESLSIALDVPAVSLHLVTVRQKCLIIYFYYCYSDYLTRFKSLSSQQLNMIAVIKPHKILSLTDLYNQFKHDNIQSYYYYEDSSSDVTIDQPMSIKETELQLWKKQAHIEDVDLSKKEAEINLLKGRFELEIKELLMDLSVKEAEMMELKEIISKNEVNSIVKEDEMMELKDIISKNEGIIKKLMISREQETVTYKKQNDKTDYGGYDTGMFLSPPSKDCECPVCRSVSKEPYQLSCCGKTICESCLKMISICPCCREPSPESKKDRKLEREIMKSQVKCTRTDCHWEGKLGDLEDHQKEDDECPMLKVKMQAIKDIEEMEFRANAAEKKISGQSKNYRSPSMEGKPTDGKTESQENKTIVAPNIWRRN